MAITAFLRGHLAEYNVSGNKWLYADNGAPITTNRPCTRCGKLPTGEGHDACLGYIEGASWACCGHGINKSYIIWDRDK